MKESDFYIKLISLMKTPVYKRLSEMFTTNEMLFLIFLKSDYNITDISFYLEITLEETKKIHSKLYKIFRDEVVNKLIRELILQITDNQNDKIDLIYDETTRKRKVKDKQKINIKRLW